MAQAKADSPQPSVRVLPGNTLTALANMYGTSVPTLEKDNPQVKPPAYVIYPGEPVNLPKQTPAKVVPPIDNAQIKPIIYAYANAQGFDQAHNVSALSSVPYGALTAAGWDTLAQSDKNWNAVGQTTYNTLLNNDRILFPNKSAATEVKALNALEPKSTQFAQQNQAALGKADTLWTNTGIIAYSNYKTTCTQQAKDHFLAVIDHSFAGVAGHGDNLAAVIKAADKQAGYIEGLGPQGQAFTSAVTSAAHGYEVNWAAGQVANAYQTGGANAAANTLKIITHAAPTPDFASEIIQNSKGTIGSITKDMWGLLSSTGTPSRSWQNGPPQSVKDFGQIYANLSQSVAAADTFTASVHLSAGGRSAAQTVAALIARNAPDSLQEWQNRIYSSAIESAIGGANGSAALSMQTAVLLKQQNESDLASAAVDGTAAGLQDLQSKTSSDYAAFQKTLGTLDVLRATWGPFMSQSQLVNATSAYLKDHTTDVQDPANAQLAVLSQDGNAVAAAMSAWRTYQPQLSGIDPQAGLSGAVQSLTRSPAGAFAISQSSNVNNAIVAAVLHSVLPTGGGGSSAVATVQNLLASPVWSLPRSWRSAINNSLKYWTKAHPQLLKDEAGNLILDEAGNPIKASPPSGTFTRLAGIGLLLSLANVPNIRAGSFQQASNGIYTLLGIPKYSADIVSQFAKTKIASNPAVFGLANALRNASLTLDPGGNPDKNTFVYSSAQNLPGALQFGKDPTTLDLTKLTKTPLFKALGSIYYGFGALSSVLEGLDQLNQGDNWNAGFSLAEGAGNALNALKPVWERLGGETAGELLGGIGSDVGAVAVLGTLAYQGIKSVEAAHAFQADSAKFLHNGLGLNMNVAAALSAPVGRSDLQTVSSELQAYASANGMKNPGQLLLELNRQPVDEVANFLNIASNLASGELVFPRGGSEQITPEQALQMLKQQADAIFGPNQVG